MVTFAPLNIAAPAAPLPGAVDVLLCRNVLMYFTREAQRATIGRLQRALVDGGWLVMSPTEASIDALRPLATVYCRGSVLRRKATRRVRAITTTERPAARIEVVPAPPRPPPLERARSAADRGRLEAARAAVYAAPESAAAHFMLGSVLLQQGAAESGRRSMEAAAAILDSIPADRIVGHDMTAGDLLAAARAHLALAA